MSAAASIPGSDLVPRNMCWWFANTLPATQTHAMTTSNPFQPLDLNPTPDPNHHSHWEFVDTSTPLHLHDLLVWLLNILKS